MIAWLAPGFAREIETVAATGPVPLLEPAEQADLRRQGEAALMAGNHAEMARVFGLLGNASNASSDDLCWLGHTHQLLGDWPAAAEAYAAALAKMGQAWGEDPASPRPAS